MKKYVFSEQAIKDLLNLELSQRKRVFLALEKMLIKPESADFEKIKAKPGTWRLKVGDWRVVLEIDPKDQEIFILRVRHRREVYR